MLSSLVAVGSSNPVKLRAVRAVVARAMPDADVRGVDVPSGVPDQPFGDALTIQGATSRAHGARRALDAQFGVGIEGGVVEGDDGSMRTCAWAVVVAVDGRMGTGGSLAMPLPPAVAQLVRGGVELGRAIDTLTGTEDTKRGPGAVGILTAGLIDRQSAYEVLVTYAMAPFLSPGFWSVPVAADPNERHSAVLP
jgi:inosine/xanthosine triphosphatase